MQNYTHFLSNIKLFLFFFAMRQRGRRQKTEDRTEQVANLIAPLLLCSLPSAL